MPSKAPFHCEECRHFSGSEYTIRWGCEKGHPEPVRRMPFRVEACPDSARMSRDEKILKLYQWEARSYGDQPFKQRAANIKRLRSGLAKLAEDAGLGKFMSPEQREGIKGALASLASLANDLDKASTLAKKTKEQEDRRRLEEHTRRVESALQLSLEKLNLKASDTLLLAEALLTFEAYGEGQVWLKARGKSFSPYNYEHFGSPSVLLEKAKRLATKEVMAALGRAIGEWLDGLLHSTYPDDAKFDDFKVYFGEWCARRDAEAAAKQQVGELLTRLSIPKN